MSLFSELRSSQHHEASDSRRSPPNYSSRRVQWRLMMLVGSLMLVLVMMDKARQPETWMWMGFDKSASPTKTTTEVDTRWSPPTQQDSTQRSSGNDDSPLQTDLTAADPSQLAEITQRDLWNKLYETLDSETRSLMFLALRASDGRSKLSVDQLSQWSQLCEKMDQHQRSYHTQILRSIASLGDSNTEKKEAWSTVLHQIQQQWDQVLREALVSAPQPQALNNVQRQALGELQKILDELALDLVEDNRILARQAEKQAWFRLFDRLHLDQAYPNLTREHVGFLQLFEQPDVYRGKRIKLTGRVRRAYLQPASDNEYGIDHYVVFWIRPDQSPSWPIAVYALAPPADFPPIGYTQQSESELDEPVEIHGYFFKKMAYQANDTTRLAPLILTHTPIWTKSAQPEATEPNLPDMTATTIAMVALGTIAIGLALSVYFATRGTRIVRRTQNEKETWAYLAKQGDLPTTEQQLLQMSQKESPPASKESE